MIRQWCHGTVLDFACGCGYGSYLIAKNPDVSKVLGIDYNATAIEHAKEQFSTPKTIYSTTALHDIDQQIDVMICIETIEHIEDKSYIPNNLNRLKIREVIISYPSKKTTHYNHYHYHDLTTKEIDTMLESYKRIDEIDLHRAVKMLRYQRNEL
jgi:2-polyprenyl-3-methyl-5-hydroxy-6-metoxy-1,4-benzoquinol methylase